MEDKSEPKTAMQWFLWTQDFADKLTLKRIFVVLMSGLLLTFVTMLFEHRGEIFQAAYSAATGGDEQQAAWDLSQETQNQLIKLTRDSSLVKMVSVIDVDLQKNRRVSRFRYLNDPDAEEITRKLSSILPQPVFDYDSKNTQQMVAVLNNEFVCAPFVDTIYQKFFPELVRKTPTVCYIAIPPFYGRFVGILMIGLKSQPTKHEIESLRLEASRLAIEIYLRDVLKKGVSKNMLP